MECKVGTPTSVRFRSASFLPTGLAFWRFEVYLALSSSEAYRFLLSHGPPRGFHAVLRASAKSTKK